MTTTPATTILNKVYVRHLIKVARGQSYASNPGGSTPTVTGINSGTQSRPVSGRSSARPVGRGSVRTVPGRIAPHPAFLPKQKTPGWVNSVGEGLNQVGRTAWNYGGKQTLLPALNAMDSIPTFAIGAANTLGGGVGNVVSGVGYGVGAATDAVGATTGAKQWVADNMWKHTNNAVHAGLQDMAGSVADAATGGAYDYNGTFADPGKHPGTAVQQNRSAIRDELRQTAGPVRPQTRRGGVGGRGMGAGALPITAEQMFNTVNGVSDFAATSAGIGGAGRGVNVAAQAIKNVPQAAPVLNAISRVPAVGRPAATAGNWLAGKAPEANMFVKSPLGYYQSMFGGNPAYAALGAVGEAAEVAQVVQNAATDPVQQHKTYNEGLPQLEQQYQQDTASRDELFRGTSGTHAMTNAMMRDPAIQNRIGHGGVPSDVASQLLEDGQITAQTPEELEKAVVGMSSLDPRTQAAVAVTNSQALAGGQMNVADGAPQTMPQAPEPSTFVQSTFPDAPPEVQTQLTDATAKVQQAAAKDPAGMAAAADPESEAGQEYINGPAFEKYTEERKDSAPDNPQEFGAWMNNMMTEFQKLDPMSQVGIGLGLGTGVLGLLSGLMGGGGIGSFLLGALGLGAAGMMGANAGMFGQSGSQMMGDMAYNLGTMTGLVPESADLSALKGENALQRLMSQGGAIGSREEVKAQIAGVRDQAGKLQQLMSLPLGDEAKIRLMQRLDPSIDSLEAGQQALTNAQQIMAAYNDPNSALNKKLLAGENYANMTGWQGDLTEKGIGAAQTAGTALGRMANTATDYLTNLFTKRTKRSTDMNIAQQIIIEQLITKSARCWAGYEPVPGKKPYSNDSCRPVGSKKKKKKKKVEKKAAGPVLPSSASPPVQSFSKTPFDAQHMIQTLGMPANTKPHLAYNKAMHLWKKNKFTPQQFETLREKYQGLPPRFSQPTQNLNPAPPASAAPMTGADRAYQQWRATQGL